MKRYLIIIEKTNSGFSAYSPDLPGCIATGNTRKDVQKKMEEALGFHLDGLREEGFEIPEPQNYSKYVEIAE